VGKTAHLVDPHIQIRHKLELACVGRQALYVRSAQISILSSDLCNARDTPKG
jgi:hypothetical protein